MLFSSLFKSAFIVTLATTILAAPRHVHNNHKREIVVVTEYQTLIVTAQAPQPGNVEYADKFSDSGSELTVSTSLTSVTFSDDQVSTDAVEPTTTPDEGSVASATSSAPVLPTSSGNFASGKGITYSPYTASGACKSLSEVQSDLSVLSGYEIIRLYGVDCNQVENVLQAKGSSQKLFLGIFFVNDIEAGISQIASAIKQYGSWDDVHTVSIGNELVNNGAASVDQIAQYVQTGRSALNSAGYTGPVVSVDTHVATLNNPGLCDISDYIAINAHAYFDQNTLAEDAGDWLLLQIERVYSACGSNKSVLVTESGWPSQGDTYGKAIASPEAQSAAIASLKEKAGNSVILFTAFNDYWKADGFLNCEKYWGFIN